MIFGLAILSALAPAEAMAAEIITKRQGCRVEQPQQQAKGPQQQQQQQRARMLDCREKRTIPPVVDPTPIFLL